MSAGVYSLSRTYLGCSDTHVHVTPPGGPGHLLEWTELVRDTGLDPGLDPDDVTHCGETVRDPRGVGGLDVTGETCKEPGGVVGLLIGVGDLTPPVGIAMRSWLCCGVAPLEERGVVCFDPAGVAGPL